MSQLSDFENKPFVSPGVLSLDANPVVAMDIDGSGASTSGVGIGDAAAAATGAGGHADGFVDGTIILPPVSDFDGTLPSLDSLTNGLKRKREFDLDGTVSLHIKPQLATYGLKSGICYDVRMRYHTRIVTSPNDYTDPHPEDPRRIYRIYKAIAEAGLIIDPTLQGAEDLGPIMEKVPVRECTEQEILTVHTQKHLDFVVSSETMTREQLIYETDHGDSIYLNNDSLKSAKLSCGGTIELCKAVVEGKVKNGIAVVRPPGHHAEPQAPGGFCLFSNVAVASKVILKEYPEKVRRILILDWDVHHGNGTQKAFIDDPRVLYISLHRYQNGTFYPSGPFGSHLTVGDGAGAGTSVNIPWQRPGMGDGDYLYAFEKVIMPIAFEYDPDLVIISAGFDAAAGDILGGCHVSPDGYGQMTHMMMQLANGHVAVILEGGYNLDSISKSAVAVTKVLIGDPPGMPTSRLPSEYAIQDVDDVIQVHKKYWKILRPGHNAIAPVNKSNEVRNMAKVVRAYQSRIYSKLGLAALPVYGTTAGLIDLDNQIMASAGVHDKQTLVVVVHDTPEIWANVDPLDGAIKTSGSKLIDAAEKFVKLAISKDWGVVDVTIPGSETYTDEDGEQTKYSSTQCAQDTMLFLWDNYLDYFDASKIVFVGLGHAYGGIVHLAAQRKVKQKTRKICAFVGTAPLVPIVPVVDEYTVEWYYSNSVIFTAEQHVAWDKTINARKPQRKYGRALKGSVNGVYQLVEDNFEDVVEFIEEAVDDDEE